MSEAEDFWGEQSPDAQCDYSTRCHVYGRNLDAYAYLLDEAKMSEDSGGVMVRAHPIIDENDAIFRAELYREEHETPADSWLGLRKPTMQ